MVPPKVLKTEETSYYYYVLVLPFMQEKNNLPIKLYKIQGPKKIKYIEWRLHKFS